MCLTLPHSPPLASPQFVVVHLRVLPYLRTTFGSESTMYITFLLFGFPTGILLIDLLMFLEPFGLLAMLPFPAWVKQFLPAYKATRIIAEVSLLLATCNLPPCYPATCCPATCYPATCCPATLPPAALLPRTRVSLLPRP